ncbi:hypothetical protein GLOTRDRAFT_131159 [Gloeophyllum trabeum ATCC 11539]|uniref:Uncharacterized protein n=1 Tax=Gloeophyllum trabeum (strain ATCC 11539 / FP-39264 / Madison 617) TaxID=670483 RepID=S7RM87_GLOTA|nr:uncharacterized protein GLOTRDRAFT_131159 [Gloeophyllum trabeum ATCC 11539]EPQ53829.1 hypothetical protein GLOTRDRAFT_131159 [Gloeophyllum trabeum ATCC 11539]
MLQPLFNKTNRDYVPLPESPVSNKFRPPSDRHKENDGKGCHASRISEDDSDAPEPFFAPQGESIKYFAKTRPAPLLRELPSLKKLDFHTDLFFPLSPAKHVLLKSRLLEFNRKVARVLFRTWIVSVLEKKGMGYREWRIYVQCHKALTARSDINKDNLPRKSLEKFRLMGVEPEDFNDEAWMPGAFEAPTQISKLTFEERKERLVRKLVAAFLVGVEKRAEERERLAEQTRVQQQEEGFEGDGEESVIGEGGDVVAGNAENDAAEGEDDSEVQSTDKTVGSDDPIDAPEAVEDAAEKPCCPNDSSEEPPTVSLEEGNAARSPAVATSPARSAPFRELGNLSPLKPADDVLARSAEEIGVLTTENAEGPAQDTSATTTAILKWAPFSTPPRQTSPSLHVKVEPSEQEVPLPAHHMHLPLQDNTYTEQGAEHLQPAAARGPPADSFACLAIGMGRAPRDDFEREVYTEGLACAYAQILARENLEYDFANQGMELPHIEDDDMLKPRMGNVWALEHDAYQTVYANAFAEVLAQEALEEEAEDSDEDERPVERMDQDWKVQIRRPRRAVEEVELADGSAMDISFHGPVDPMECEVTEGPADMPVTILAGLAHVDEEPMDVDFPDEAGDIDIHDASMMSMAPFDFAQPAHPLQDILGAFGNISLWSKDAIEVDAHLDC